MCKELTYFKVSQQSLHSWHRDSEELYNHFYQVTFSANSTPSMLAEWTLASIPEAVATWSTWLPHAVL